MLEDTNAKLLSRIDSVEAIIFAEGFLNEPLDYCTLWDKLFKAKLKFLRQLLSLASSFSSLFN